MFDWAFAAAFQSIMQAIRFIFWVIRGVVWMVSAVLNRRNLQ